jgi:hypothetical protein
MRKVDVCRANEQPIRVLLDIHDSVQRVRRLLLRFVVAGKLD